MKQQFIQNFILFFVKNSFLWKKISSKYFNGCLYLNARQIIIKSKLMVNLLASPEHSTILYLLMKTKLNHSLQGQH